MAEQLVFVPLSHAEAGTLRAAGSLAGTFLGQAATPALLRAHDYDSTTLEDAEFAALSYAGVRAVLEPPGVDEELRLVLAVEVPSASVDIQDADPYGTVEVGGLRWSAVRALFADEPAAREAVSETRSAAVGRTLDEALSLAAVNALTDSADLLWFNPDELDHVFTP